LKKNFQSHSLGFSTVANNREGFFELFYFHIYLIYSQINLAKSYYDDHYLGYIPHNCDGVGAEHLGVGYTPLFGQISQGTEFCPKMQKKSVFGDF
jgi:hypothetical protein